jgi:hypothetical protein
MPQNDSSAPDDSAPDSEASRAAALHEKFVDILTIGVGAAFDPDEAEQAGAFAEDALSVLDAVESCLDALQDGAGAGNRETLS